MAEKQYTLRVPMQTSMNAFLRATLPSTLHCSLSHSKIRRLIMAGMVQIGGRVCRNPSEPLRAGTLVSVRIVTEKLLYEKPANDIAFTLTAREVLYEDESIILVNKPAFFPSEAGMVKSRDNLHAAVVRYLFARQQKEQPHAKNPPYVGSMHRLDHETSGVILFTKTRAVNAAFHDLFARHAVQKRYYALVCPKNDTRWKQNGAVFSVTVYMGRISPTSQAAKWGVVAEEKGGVYSKTDVRVGESCILAGKKIVQVECLLHTGRTHQIRVHLAHSGAPLLGDTLYGGVPYTRIMLHAYALSFVHPITGESLTVTAPLPDLFQRFGFGLPS